MTESLINTDHVCAKLDSWSVCAVVFWLFALSLSLGFNQQYSEWLGGAGIALMCFFGLSSLRQNLAWNLSLIALWGFWLCWLVAAWLSPVGYISETALWSMVALPICATATYWLVRSQPAIWSFFFAGLLVFGLALAFYGCYQYFVELQLPRGTFINKNNFAALLMMVLLVSIGRYILNFSRQKSWFYSLAVLASVFILSFVIGLIESRGATLALTCGMFFILVAGFALFDEKRRVLTAIGVSLIGLLLATAVGLDVFGGEVASLPSPFELSDDNGRFAIWAGAVDMLSDVLPFGIGPGLFWLVYPQFRLPEDASGGFYVHNDYLQFLIEAGPAAPLVFLIVAALITFQVFRLALVSEIDSRLKLEAMVLFAAISALAGHSMLTFNLYLLPILIVAGTLTGRLFILLESGGAHMPADSSSNARGWKNGLTRLLSLVVLGFSVLFYIKAVGGGMAFNEAIKLSNAEKWNESTKYYQKAISFWPGVDVYHYSHAWSLFEKKRAEVVAPKGDDFIDALRLLDIAEELNPYRPQPHFLRARIFEVIANKQKDGVAVLDSATDDYRDALELDPLYLDARFRLARILLNQNKVEQGLEVLERGLVWSYEDSQVKQQYYRLTAEIRRILGDNEGYAELIERSRRVADALRRKAIKKSERKNFFR
jgi:O-antigen ligase